jgi:putative membrane protein
MYNRILILSMLAASAPLALPQMVSSFARTVSFSHRDSTFLKTAAEGGMDEVKLGELAQQNAASERVRKFGQKSAADHNKMGEDIRILASSRNLSLPSDIGLKDKASYYILAAKRGAEFDKAYILAMIKDHENDLAAFRKEADEGNDEGVKAFAFKSLRTLEEHLKMAQDIGRDLGVYQ